MHPPRGAGAEVSSSWANLVWLSRESCEKVVHEVSRMIFKTEHEAQQEELDGDRHAVDIDGA